MSICPDPTRQVILLLFTGASLNFLTHSARGKINIFLTLFPLNKGSSQPEQATSFPLSKSRPTNSSASVSSPLLTPLTLLKPKQKPKPPAAGYLARDLHESISAPERWGSEEGRQGRLALDQCLPFVACRSVGLLVWPVEEATAPALNAHRARSGAFARSSPTRLLTYLCCPRPPLDRRIPSAGNGRR